MTQQQWDLIGYGVWALIIWMTLKQFRQTRRPVQGKGLNLLLGDWLLFAPLPWIVYRMIERGTWEQLAWTLGLGILLSLPYILTTKFQAAADGTIKFKPNAAFYIFLFGFPYLRYTIRDRIFHSHPILSAQHRPDIELMLAEYIAVLVLLTFLWRLFMFISYRRTLRAAAAQGDTRTDQSVITASL
ncbi:CcdC protein domain-containing protein [Paenibacillus zeisoli]|nr:CcdC protein domain-containing protein [Paenibacillus zeisoli]